ncbi:hypothetical protein [Variovorax sp. tm]|uniref:hypothetical protein n=1 Tax=Variovorax atrisoli TaxID=3394203 RepID=UPI003A7FDB94
MAFTFDTDTVVTVIANVVGVVALVGVARLGVDAALLAFRVVLDVIDGGSRTGLNMTTSEQAQALQEAGLGQSAAYADYASTAAYDAGYSGREFDASWGEEHRAKWEQARSDRQEDLAKGWK